MSVLKKLSAILFVISAYICLPVILVVLTVDVTLRFGFNAPIRWAQELASILLFLAVVLALPESWLKHAHVKADFLRGFIGDIGHEVMVRVKWLLVLLLSVVIIWQCWRDAEFMLLIDESTPELYVPLVYLRGALALGSVLSGLIALVNLFARYRLGDENEEVSP